MNLRRKLNTDKLLRKTINLKGIPKVINDNNKKDTPTMNQNNLNPETPIHSNINIRKDILNTKTNVLNS
jgi:hypothetical protein